MAVQSPEPPADAINREGPIDPQRADVGTAKRRRRKVRNREEPHADLNAWKVGAEKRIKRQHIPPILILEPAGMDKEHMVPVHNDQRLSDLQLCEAFGTRSFPVIATFLQQLEMLCQDKWWDEAAQQWRMDETTFNAALAIVSAVKPRNEMEAAHAAQMAAIHLLTMKVTARAIRYEYDTKTSAAAGKLARTFTLQMQELRAMRGKTRTTRQNIKVTKELHQHVHYHDGRGVGETGGQSHARSGDGYRKSSTADERPALPGADESGRVVPLPSRSRTA